MAVFTRHPARNEIGSLHPKHFLCTPCLWQTAFAAASVFVIDGLRCSHVCVDYKNGLIHILLPSLWYQTLGQIVPMTYTFLPSCKTGCCEIQIYYIHFMSYYYNSSTRIIPSIVDVSFNSCKALYFLVSRRLKMAHAL